MRCQACNHECRCPRVLHTGEGKVLVGLTRPQLEELLDVIEGGGRPSQETLRILMAALNLVT